MRRLALLFFWLASIEMVAAGGPMRIGSEDFGPGSVIVAAKVVEVKWNYMASVERFDDQEDPLKPGEGKKRITIPKKIAEGYFSKYAEERQRALYQREIKTETKVSEVEWEEARKLDAAALEKRSADWEKVLEEAGMGQEDLGEDLYVAVWLVGEAKLEVVEPFAGTYKAGDTLTFEWDDRRRGSCPPVYPLTVGTVTIWSLAKPEKSGKIIDFSASRSGREEARKARDTYLKSKAKKADKKKDS